MNCGPQRVLVGMGASLLAAHCRAIEPTPVGSLPQSDVKAEIQAGLPAYGESQKAPEPSSAPNTQELQMAAHIKRLPREQFRPPRGEDILTAQGKAEAAMEEYLGTRDALDRAVLNRVTLPQLWQQIPLLKYLPCPLPGVTNEARAESLKADVDYSQALHDDIEFDALSGSGPRLLPRSNLSP